MNKILGYVLAGAGVIALGISYPSVRTALKIPIPSMPVSDNIIMFVGAALLLVGVFLAFNKTSKQPAEVPIYEGKNIVGYRRMKK
jgi:sulfite exporter TauE/SafE